MIGKASRKRKRDSCVTKETPKEICGNGIVVKKKNSHCKTANDSTLMSSCFVSLSRIMVRKSPPKKTKFVSYVPKETDELDTASVLKEFEVHRKKVASSVQEFKFNKKRVRVLSKANEIPHSAQGVLYWMSRDQRVQDNWAFLFAQKLALKVNVALHICFCVVPKSLDSTIREYNFLLKGLEEVASECNNLNIQFHLLFGHAAEVLPKLVSKYNLGAVVTDFSPLRIPRKWVDDVKAGMPDDVPFCQVDAHNIVPCWITSNKVEYMAGTIRKKIDRNLPEFLTSFPPVIKHPYISGIKADPINWAAVQAALEVDRSVEEITWAKPGTTAGLCMLDSFCHSRLKMFADKRNDPTQNALSNLSPWFHFGHISVQRAILKIKEFKLDYPASVDAFCEQAIIRRELADNFCFYNDNYDNINGTYPWAKQTLHSHRNDKREYIYSKEKLEQALTHDDLWNSAQLQLVKEGKMHGLLRLYWAKKILEWTESPEEALAVSFYLNDKYSLDGRDPNGYVGCMLSICGVHDHGYPERKVFGKIRYMNYQGCLRKFNVAAFVERWGGKVHKYKWKG